MHSGSRGRIDHHPPRRMRAAVITAVVAVLGVTALAPSATAGPTEDLNAIARDYGSDRDIASCRFTKAQLLSARSQIPLDYVEYAYDFVLELNREIARWNSGGCSGTTANGSQAAYRASIISLKVAKSRRSVKVKLKCPAAAPSSCKVKLSAKLATKKAATSRRATIKPGKTKSLRLKLKRATTRKLKDTGGMLKISAKTTGSSLSAASRTAEVKPPGS